MYLTRSELEQIAQRVLSAYKRKKENAELTKIDPLDLAQSLLNLTVDYRHLSLDGRDLGVTSSDEAGVQVFGEDEDMYILDGKTILVERDLLAPQHFGRMNFTVAHEIAHQILFMLFPEKNDTYPRARKVAYYREAPAHPVDWVEWQANVIAECLLMPRDIVTNALHAHGIPDKIHILNKAHNPYVFQKFSDCCQQLGVSKQALALRLKRIGILHHDYYNHPFDMMDIYPEEDEEI